jgi:hypothetical protein
LKAWLTALFNASKTSFPVSVTRWRDLCVVMQIEGASQSHSWATTELNWAASAGESSKWSLFSSALVKLFQVYSATNSTQDKFATCLKWTRWVFSPTSWTPGWVFPINSSTV